ncbi:MAG: ribonuclease J [Clostridia bacterium]
MNKKPKTLKVIPLGGLHEIGKNITVFEYGGDIIIVDCGMAFPGDDLLGIDYVIPDFTYLKNNKEKIRGIVITHGHEDHIGSLPYLLKEINVPIYATCLTLGLIKGKLEEHKLLKNAQLNTIKAGELFTLGLFRVEAIRVTHSIPDCLALAIYSPVGTVLHTGDFKVDYTPIQGEAMDMARLAELGKKGVLMLMCDSTNVERAGYTISERSIGATFDSIFMNATGRILVASFASNVHRIQQAFDAAIKVGRKVALCGRSMENVVGIAIELGYLRVPEDLLVDINKIKKYTNDQIVIVTTGSQGEPMAALSRIAVGEHRNVQITPGDTVVISASPIPGNEKTVSNVINNLMARGAEVIYNDLMDVHVSGHACQEELKLIQCLIKPKYFMPVHGEYRHLLHHGVLAVGTGVEMENVFILDNGDVLEISPTYGKVTGTVPAGRVLIDGLGVGDVGNLVLKDRKHLSEDGLIIVTLTMQKGSNKLLSEPDLTSRGFVYVKDSEDLMVLAKGAVRSTISAYNRKGKDDKNILRNMIRDDLKDFVYAKTKRRPMIIPVITEV